MWNPSILVITNYRRIATYLESKLTEKNYEVKTVSDSFTGLICAQNCSLSLILVAWQTSEQGIISFCEQLRRVQSSIPLITLIQGDDSKFRIACLEAGATDCLSSPFHLDEILARIHAQLRLNAKAEEPSQLHYENILLNLETYQAYRGEHRIDLTAKEFNLLEYFMRHPQRVLTRNQILDNVWGYDFEGMSNVVEVYIASLRRKLEANHSDRLIQTIRHVGYILRA
ncbi:MAG: response regulator transcription factor [Leptolyngbyaceae bacterium]|nr:response regulator transcription factor [Leptolyngbyaceae bacterium]